MIFNTGGILNHESTLLWTNPDPTVGFSGLIEIDMNRYALFYVVVASWVDTEERSTPCIYTNIIINNPDQRYQTVIASHTDYGIYDRTVKLTDTGLDMSSKGSYKYYSTDDTTYSDEYVIPICVYGVYKP